MEKLTEQELHNLAMNIVGKELEAEGYEFLAINSTLKKNPQYVCLKDKITYLIVVRAISYPQDPKDYSKKLMKTMSDHANEHNATACYAGVGLINEADYTAALTLNQEYIVRYEGLIKF